VVRCKYQGTEYKRYSLGGIGWIGLWDIGK